MCFTKYSGGKGSCACCFCRIKKQFTILVSTLVKYLKALCTLQSTRKMLYRENINPHCVMFLFIKQSWCDSSQSSSG